MTRFARGWHCIGLADNFRDGEPTASRRSAPTWWCSPTRPGALHVLDAYCRHMGGDLSQGTVKGDDVACPFHDWRWQGSTAAARWCPTPSARPGWPAPGRWPTQEVNGQLLVWHDPEGSAPPPELRPPTIEGYAEGHWSPWQLELDPHRGFALPRDRRQQRRHGPLLLHPPRVPDVLQERHRGPHRQPVHGVQGRGPMPRRTTKTSGRERICARRRRTSARPT